MAEHKFQGEKNHQNGPSLFLKATHLAEFHQIEGFVADRRASQQGWRYPKKRWPKTKTSESSLRFSNLPIGIPKVPQSSRRKDENASHFLEGSKLMWPECCPCHFLGWDLPQKSNNVAFFGLGFMTRMTPYTRVVWVVFFQKGRSWGCKFYQEIRSKHCKLRCFYLFFLFLFFFCPSGNIGLPQLIGVLRDFFARIGISKLRLLEPKFEDWKNLHGNSWNPKQHRYLTPKRKIKHEIFEVLYLLYLL